jgi:hypothetical protein
VGSMEGLIASIRAHGLLHPIAVTKDGTLVAGRRRLEACRALGWTEIPVVMIDADKAQAALVEAEENLCHAELSLCERALVLLRCQQAYEEAHPLTKPGARGRAAWTAELARRSGAVKADDETRTTGEDAEGDAAQLRALCNSPRNVELFPSTPNCDLVQSGEKEQCDWNESADYVPAFADAMASRINVASRTIRSWLAIARHLAPDAARLLTTTRVGNNRSQLTQLARLPSDDQVRIAKLLSERRARNIDDAEAMLRGATSEPMVKAVPTVSLLIARPSRAEAVHASEWLRNLCEAGAPRAFVVVDADVEALSLLLQASKTISGMLWQVLAWPGREDEPASGACSYRASVRVVLHGYRKDAPALTRDARLSALLGEESEEALVERLVLDGSRTGNGVGTPFADRAVEEACARQGRRFHLLPTEAWS